MWVSLRSQCQIASREDARPATVRGHQSAGDVQVVIGNVETLAHLREQPDVSLVGQEQIFVLG